MEGDLRLALLGALADEGGESEVVDVELGEGCAVWEAGAGEGGRWVRGLSSS